MLLREIRDKGATVAWSPFAKEPSLLALATKEGGGAGFDDYGGELQVQPRPYLVLFCIISSEIPLPLSLPSWVPLLLGKPSGGCASLPLSVPSGLYLNRNLYLTFSDSSC